MYLFTPLRKVEEPVQENISPLDIEGIDSDFTKEELNAIVREGRERYNR